MLEKDIENLLARYPDEFMRLKGLKLVGQQVKLDSYFADIIFQDKSLNKIVVEVKRGILPRDAIPQIMDYYGVIKLTQPETNIKLIIIANVIPKERIILLSERLGIEFIEVPITKLIKIAKKYNYIFLDADKKQTKQKYQRNVKEINKNILKAISRVWIFQSNPERFDILNALEELDEDAWGVRRYKTEIKAGDIGLIWMSGSKDGGIYAISEIITNPDYISEAKEVAKFWHAEDDKEKVKLRVKLKYKLKFLNNPILRSELKNIDELKNMSIFRQAQGVNHPVTESEWNIISELVKQRLS